MRWPAAAGRIDQNRAAELQLLWSSGQVQRTRVLACECMRVRKLYYRDFAERDFQTLSVCHTDNGDCEVIIVKVMERIGKSSVFKQGTKYTPRESALDCLKSERHPQCSIGVAFIRHPQSELTDLNREVERKAGSWSSCSLRPRALILWCNCGRYQRVQTR